MCCPSTNQYNSASNWGITMTFTYSKVGHTETLSDKIQREIEKSILQKQITAGEKLPTEKELCEMFGVSRTALREALKMLSIQGLITIRKGSGIYVREYTSTYAIMQLTRYLRLNLDSDLIQGVMDMRSIFEPQIASLAAKNRTDSDLLIMKGEMEKLNSLNSDENDSFSTIESDIHLKICEATYNPIITMQMQPIYRVLPQIRTLMNRSRISDTKISINSLQKVIDAIQAQNSDRAHEAMVKHLVVER